MPEKIGQKKLALKDWPEKIGQKKALDVTVMSETLAQQTCIPCSGALPPATPAEIAQFHLQIPQWQLIESEGVP